MIGLNEFCAKAHERAKEKGFWEEPKPLGVSLMQITGELGEALQADMKGRHADPELVACLSVLLRKKDVFSPAIFETLIKDTVEDELTDAFIRLCDLIGYMDFDFESHIRLKMQFNKTRPHKHGKNY
jgi:NTP pyrophosphatase (non-canonical NTP hydrolase)